jgi:hypothetical protein
MVRLYIDSIAFSPMPTNVLLDVDEVIELAIATN